MQKKKRRKYSYDEVTKLDKYEYNLKLDQMKSLIEPILICFLAAVVGVILISIIQPMTLLIRI